MAQRFGTPRQFVIADRKREKALFIHDIGLDYSVALNLHLYFYTLRDIISWALQQGLKYYYSNPLNYEPKLHLDCELVPLDL